MEGFDKPEILAVFNAGAKMKPEYRLSIRGFHFCDKAEDEQKIGFAKPSYDIDRSSEAVAEISYLLCGHIAPLQF